MVAVGRALAFVIVADAGRGEVERAAQLGVECLISVGAGRGLDPPTRLVQVVAVELSGIGGDRGLAPVLYRAHDRGDVAGHVGAGLAARVDEGFESGGEAGFAGREMDHAARA